MSAVLDVQSLCVSTSAGTPIVTDVSFTVSEGQSLGLVGESGSGKSLTGLACMSLLPRGVQITAGEILVEETRVASAAPKSRERRKIAMIFQNPMTSLNPTMRIGAQIEEALHYNSVTSQARQTFSSATELLRLVDIPEPERRARQWPHELSGGQRQRVVIAIALACNSKVLIADEPTTALDVTTQAGIVALLDRLRKELGLAIMFISHDLALISNICSNLLVMYAGQIVESGPTGHLLQHPRHPYLRGLLDCLPGNVDGELRPMPGRIPQPGSYSEGCRFAPRCPYAQERCLHPQSLLDINRARTVRCIRYDEILENDTHADLERTV